MIWNAKLDEQISNQPPAPVAEIRQSSTLARRRSLEWALPVPVLAALLGLLRSFRIMGLPISRPCALLEGSNFD